MRHDEQVQRFGALGASIFCIWAPLAGLGIFCSGSIIVFSWSGVRLAA